MVIRLYNHLVRIVVVMLFRLEAIVEAVLREQNTTYYVGLTLEYIYPHARLSLYKYIPA
jgi:hypothetical protein